MNFLCHSRPFLSFPVKCAHLLRCRSYCTLFRQRIHRRPDENGGQIQAETAASALITANHRHCHHRRNHARPRDLTTVPLLRLLLPQHRQQAPPLTLPARVPPSSTEPATEKGSPHPPSAAHRFSTTIVLYGWKPLASYLLTLMLHTPIRQKRRWLQQATN